MVGPSFAFRDRQACLRSSSRHSSRDGHEHRAIPVDPILPKRGACGTTSYASDIQGNEWAVVLRSDHPPNTLMAIRPSAAMTVPSPTADFRLSLSESITAFALVRVV